MSENFEIAHKMTSAFEGGWVHHPNDKGGETAFGISRVAHPGWQGWAAIDIAKLDVVFPRNINHDENLKAMAKEFYREKFWNEINGDELPLPVALAVYDMAVNFNPKKAVRQLQVLLGVEPDGVVGQKTIKAAHDDMVTATKDVIVSRIKRHFERVAQAPDQAVFLDGWVYRCVGLAMQIGRHL